jgi:alpha-2-macroglobulin
MTYTAALMKDTVASKLLMVELVRNWYQPTWHSTQEISTALLAFSMVSQQQPSGSEVEYEITLPGQEVQKARTSPKQMVYSIKPGSEGDIRIKSLTGLLFVRVESGGIPLAGTLGGFQTGLVLDRTFYNDGGSAITLEQTEPGTPFWVGYRVKSLAGRALQGLALSSLFPSGWEIINPRLRDDLPKWLQNKSVPQLDYMDIRDDRVDWFFSMGPGGTAEFYMRVVPTFEGDYVLPAVAVEAMYSPEYRARLASGRVVIRGDED